MNKVAMLLKTRIETAPKPLLTVTQLVAMVIIDEEVLEACARYLNGQKTQNGSDQADRCDAGKVVRERLRERGQYIPPSVTNMDLARGVRKVWKRSGIETGRNGKLLTAVVDE